MQPDELKANALLKKLGIFRDSDGNDFYYLNSQQEKTAISAQEAGELYKNFTRLEKEAEKTSNGSAEELLGIAGIKQNKNGQYLNSFSEPIPPQKLIEQLNSLIETDKLLQGINFTHTNKAIIAVPIISEAAEVHQAMHTKNIIKNIKRTANFVAGFAGMGISMDDESCCDLSRLKPQFSNDGNNEKAVLFEWENSRNSISVGIRSPNAVKGFSAHITGTWR